MKVRLIREWRGYRPEINNWEEFRPSRTSGVIVHDLYHHYPNETGTAVEEFRSIGARVRFDDVWYWDNGLKGFAVGDGHFEDHETTGERTVFKKGRESLPKIAETILNNKFVQTSDKVDRSVNLEQLTQMLTENYERVLQYPLKAYKKLRIYDFAKHHSLHEELIVNLMTGNVKVVPKAPKAVKLNLKADSYTEITFQGKPLTSYAKQVY